MIADKKEFSLGLGLLIGFFVILVFIFMPIFNGQNGLNYLDSLYNSISKGSAYYIPQMKGDVQKYEGTSINIELAFSDENLALQMADLFKADGVVVKINGNRISIDGDLGEILKQSLEVADNMYHNKGNVVSQKYGYSERQVLHNWWSALKGMDRELNNQELYDEAKIVSSVQKKAVECAYNYYGIVPEKISDKMWIVLFSLVFYVIYTLWYGFAIMYMFEGWGLKLEKH